MKPIYFPFTYVPKWVAEALTACFKNFIVYQPSGRKLPDEMQPWVDAQRMEVRIPVCEDDQMLDAVVNDFQVWANLHHDSKELKTAAVLGQQSSIPFFNETALSQIVADIKNPLKTETAKGDFDPFFCAQVFLHFAQEFDRQNYELNHALGLYDQRAQGLIKNLKGEAERLTRETHLVLKSSAPSEHMALERLQAWTELFQKDPAGSGLFITTSQSVFDHFIETLPTAEMIFKSNLSLAFETDDIQFKRWRERILNNLARLAETDCLASKGVTSEMPEQIRGDPNAALTLYLVPNQNPHEFFTQYAAPQLFKKSVPNQIVKFKNTLIGIIER
jgi:hypothetical protein